jgi:hypothetical protein
MPILHFPRQFNGPPESANGGVAAGAMAEILLSEETSAVRVRLMRPIPLEQDLALRNHPERDGLIAHDDDGDILAGWREPLTIDMPALPDGDRVVEAGAHYRMPTDDKFAGCFVCGHTRLPGEGLRIHAGHDQEENAFAAVHWTPHENFAGDDGELPSHLVWGALDCPGAVAALLLKNSDMLTGEMHGEVFAPVRAGETYTVFAWPIWTAGRKIFTGSALIDETGQVCAKASELWITV